MMQRLGGRGEALVTRLRVTWLFDRQVHCHSDRRSEAVVTDCVAVHGCMHVVHSISSLEAAVTKDDNDMYRVSCMHDAVSSS